MILSRFFFPNLPQTLRARLAICASFFIQGAMFATWCSGIPEIKARLMLTEATLGTLLLCLPAGQFCFILPAGLCVKRFGSRAMLLLAGCLYPLCVIALGYANTFFQTASLLFLAGAIANLSNTAANTQGVLLERIYGRSIMAFFHGMWSLAGFVAVGCSILFRAFEISLALHFTIMAIGAITLLSFSGGALVMDPPENKANADSKGWRAALHEWRFPPLILWLGIACFGCMACEGAVYDWSSVYLREMLNVPAKWQGFGYFAYLITMVTGRFVIDLFVNRFGRQTILRICSLAILIGFSCVLIAPWLPLSSFVITLIGFALIGCGTCAVVPLCCASAGKCRELSPGIAITEISTIGFFGFLITPPLIGYLGQLWTLQGAFILLLFLAALTLFAVIKCHLKD